jgi:hypothetical protein
MESALGHDFGRVRVHAEARAAKAAATVGAEAFTVGQHVVFGEGNWRPGTPSGERLLAHELVHVMQQAASTQGTGHLEVSQPDEAPEREAAAVTESVTATGDRARPAVGLRCSLSIQRQLGTPFAGHVRSPVVEEFLTQETEVMAGLQGAPLKSGETKLARSVFGDSVDYSRVRLLRAPEVLWFKTVGNVIRVPSFFTVDPSATVPLHLSVDYMRQTFIHEMTHVWQYQHGGTSYISYSLGPQIAAIAAAVPAGISAVAAGEPIGQAVENVTAARDAAYIYTPDPHKSFWNFTPEQQGLIVENYFLMHKKSAEAIMGGPDGKLHKVTDPAVIGSLRTVHERYIAQMRAALPAPEADIQLQRRASEAPAGALPEVPPERRLTPVKPLLEIRF